MWKVFLGIIFTFFVIAASMLYSEVRKDKKRMNLFRQAWDTKVVGIIDSFKLFTGDAGVIYFKIEEIKGNRHDVINYTGGPFYLLTNNKKGKLIEGGMNSIAKGDILLITDKKDFVVLRNNDIIFSRPIYFRDVPALWKNANLEELENYWEW